MLYIRRAKPEDALEKYIDSGKLKEGRRDLVMVAFDDDRLVGACSMEINGDEGEINSVFVNVESRGKGIGEALISSALNVALRRGVNRVLVSYKEEVGAFFKKIGFSPSNSKQVLLVVDLEKYFTGCCKNSSFQGKN